jgi:hypothetical protein
MIWDQSVVHKKGTIKNQSKIQVMSWWAKCKEDWKAGGKIAWDIMSSPKKKECESCKRIQKRTVESDKAE